MSSSAKKNSVESMDDYSDSVMEDSNSVVSSKPEGDKQPRFAKKKGSDTSTSSTTNDPTSTSATASVATAVARHPISQSGLPNLPPAAAAAPPLPRQRRAGFREQFLQKLRVMLDYESQNDSAIVHWSTDGNSFIITDQKQFEADMIPTYFDNPIVFASFLSKLYRWGFNRLSSKSASKSGRYEFRSPTFRRLGSNSEPAAAVAAAAADTSSNAGGGAAIPVQQQQQEQQQQQQQQQTQAPPPLQQLMAQTNQPPAPNPPLPSQVDGIADLFSNIQRNSQQPSISNQQSVLNQNTNQPNNADAYNFLQGILGNTTLPSQNSGPNQQPVQNQSTNNNHHLNMNLTLPPIQPQWQHPNPTTNLLNTALSLLVGNQTPSAPQMDYSPVSHQGGAIQALMSLYGMSSSHAGGTFPNSNTTSTISQPNNTAQSLLMLIHRVCEDERQRRAQADAVQSAIIASIGQILGVSNTTDEAERQRGLVAALGQMLGSTGEATTPNNIPPTTNPTGMTVRVPHASAAAGGGQMQQGIPPPSAAGNLNFQIDPIAAIIHAARSGAAGGQLEEDVETQIDEGNDDRPLSPRKRKSPDDGYGADDSRRKK